MNPHSSHLAFVAAVAIASASNANAAPPERAVVLVGASNLSLEELQGIEFKIRIEARKNGLDPVGLPPDAPAITDPWRMNCMKDDGCLGALASYAGVELVIPIGFTHSADGLYYAALKVRRRDSAGERIDLRATSLSDLEMKLGLALAQALAFPPPPVAPSVPVPADNHATTPPPEPTKQPGRCIDIFAAQQSAEAPTAGDGPVFIKPKVLVLAMNGLQNASPRYATEFRQAIEERLLGAVRMKRIELVEHCGSDGDPTTVSLTTAQSRAIYGAEWAFAVNMLGWKELKQDKSYAMTSEFEIKVFKVADGRLVEELSEAVEVPTFFDSLVFSGQDAGRAALEGSVGNASKSATLAVAKVAGAAVAANVGLGAASPKSPDAMEYEYRLNQNLEMAGAKLALAVKNHRRFRLASPILKRDGDDVGFGVGESEGVHLSDTYVFYRGDPDAWDGFARVTSVGPGGKAGSDAPSYATVIGDYADEPGIQIIEYPLIGIQIGVATGIIPMRHDQIAFNNGTGAMRRGFGAPGLSLDVKFRIPWLPVSELYQTNTINYVFANPLTSFSLEPGLEKRWLLGRFSPLVGARYSLASVSIPYALADDAASSASARASGIEGYAGFAVYLHPVITLQVQAGYRQYFGKLETFEHDDEAYALVDFGGRPQRVDLSGPSVKLAFAFEI